MAAGPLQSAPLRILLVEDNSDDVLLLRHLLEWGAHIAFELTNVSRLSLALEVLGESPADIVVLDLTLPDSRGVDTLRKLQQAAVAIPIVVLTGMDDEDLAVQCVDLGAQDYLVKGQVGEEILWRSLRYAIRRKQAEEEQRLRVHQEAALAALGLRAVGGKSLDVLTREALEQLRECLDADLALFKAIGEEGRQSFGPDQFNGDSCDSAGLEAAIDDLIQNSFEHQRFRRAAIRVTELDLPGCGGLCALIPIDGRPAGLLGVFHCGERRTIAGGKNFLQSTGNVLGLAAQRQKEEALRKRQEIFFRDIAEHLGEGVLITTTDGQILFSNPESGRILGLAPEATIGRSLSEFLSSEEDSAAYGERLLGLDKGLGGSPLEVRLTQPSGAEVWVELRLTALEGQVEGEINALTAVIDLTERRSMEQRLSQAERMEAVGRLAGGVAHDFNNLLTVINGNSELIMSRMGEGTDLYTQVQQIYSAGYDAAHLVEQLLAYSRQQPVEVIPLSLNREIEYVECLLERVLRENIQLRLELDSAAPVINANPGQLHQILLNLAVNARDAMPDGGLLEIGTRLLNGSDTEEPEVELSVRDSGIGIDEEALPHIFEPFFSTKETGKGTGLGLATVEGLVHQSGGSISVESRIGNGSEFNLRFPLHQGEAVDAEERDSTVSKGDLRGLVLLIEDQPRVLKLTKRLLEAMGLNVHTAMCGEEGLDILRSAQFRFDLVLSDIVMPGISGWDVAGAVEEMQPGLPTILMTGYSEAVSESLERDLEVLWKPFDREVLYQAMQANLTMRSAV